MRGEPRDLIELGIVQPMAFPEAAAGEALLESVRWLVEDGRFDLVEVPHVAREATRQQLRALVRERGGTLLYAAQPVLLSQGLSLNDPDDSRRHEAVSRTREALEEAAELGAVALALLSGPNPAAEERSAQLDLLVESLLRLSLPAEGGTGVPVLLENFDQLDFGKNCLVGPTAEAAEVVRRVRREGGRCGLLVDLSHLPLLGESAAEALGAAADVLQHVHIGNCVTGDPEHPAYGDNHPVLGIPEGENGVEELAEFLRQLLRVGYLGEGRRRVSFEVKPFGEQRPEEVVAESQRILKEAWEKV